jgi:hypothetical protein
MAFGLQPALFASGNSRLPPSLAVWPRHVSVAHRCYNELCMPGLYVLEPISSLLCSLQIVSTDDA